MKVIYQTLGKYQCIFPEFIHLFKKSFGSTLEVVTLCYDKPDNSILPSNFSIHSFGEYTDDVYKNGFNDRLIEYFNEFHENDDIVMLLMADMLPYDKADIEELHRIERIMKKFELDRVALCGYLMDPSDERESITDETTLFKSEFMDIQGNAEPFMHPALWRVDFLKEVLSFHNTLGYAELAAVGKAFDNELSDKMYQSKTQVVFCYDICENGEVAPHAVNFTNNRINVEYGYHFYRAMCTFNYQEQLKITMV